MVPPGAEEKRTIVPALKALRPLVGVPLVKVTGVPVAKAICAGITSMITIELESTARLPTLRTVIAYSTIAPGISLGLTVPLRGSEMTRLVFSITSVAVERAVLVMVQVMVSPGRGVIVPPTAVGSAVVEPVVAFEQAIVTV